MAFAENVSEICRDRRNSLPELVRRKRALLGELVIPTGTANLSTEALAGALLEAAEARSTEEIASWTKRGRAFFGHEGQAAP